MILEEIKNIDSSCNQLKKFGYTMGVVFVLIGFIGYYYNYSSAYYFSGIGGLFIILGYVVPVALLPLHKIWMSLAVVLSFFSSRVILAILFYVILTPIGFLGRLFGKEFLKVKPNNKLETYWEPRESEKYVPEQTERQF